MPLPIRCCKLVFLSIANLEAFIFIIYYRFQNIETDQNLLQQSYETASRGLDYSYLFLKHKNVPIIKQIGFIAIV